MVNLAAAKSLPKLAPVKVNESPAARLAGLMPVTRGEYDVDLAKVQALVQTARSVSLPYRMSSCAESSAEPRSEVMQVNDESSMSSSISHV